MHGRPHIIAIHHQDDEAAQHIEHRHERHKDGTHASDGLDASQQKHILGVQANLWTEYIGTPEYLEYMLLPRMAALSEIQWCKPSDKDFDRFASSMKAESFKIYDNLGYNYRKF